MTAVGIVGIIVLLVVSDPLRARLWAFWAVAGLLFLGTGILRAAVGG